MKPDVGGSDENAMLGKKSYQAGDNVPITGLYRVSHYQHRMPHDVVIKQGTVFPACNKCGTRVTFALSNTAESLTSDTAFMAKIA